MQLENLAEKLLTASDRQEIPEAMVQISKTTAKEFNIEANKITLLRSTFDQSVSLKSLVDKKQGSASGNQFTEEALNNLAIKSSQAAKASPADEGNGFAPAQGSKSFEYGFSESNDEWMYSQLDQFLINTKAKFPQIIIEGSVVKFVQKESVLATNTGTLLKNAQAYYEGFTMFTAKEGKKSSSFNYTGFQIPSQKSMNQQKSLEEVSGLSQLLQQSSEQIETGRIPEKFTGDIIVTPHCMELMLDAWLGFLSSGPLLKKSSFFQGQLGKKVASEKWTLKSLPIDSNFASRSNWTSDGYLANNEVLFENGILKSYLLGHYAANKLQESISRSGGQYLQLKAGTEKLVEMISKVKKGVLLCRYSAGMPAENGDISGVAKNSYYIENGKLKFPLGETMVTGNLSQLLNEIQDVSAETINSGYWEFPWIRFSGLTIS